MHEQQQPHLEILSHNRVNRSTIIVAVIPVTIFSLVLVYAIWSFLWLLAYGAMALLSISGLYLVAILAIDVRRRWLHAPYIHVEEQNGMFNTKAGRMYPLALPPPVITEVPTLPDDRPAHVPLDHWRILQLAGKGMDLRSVALACNTTYYQVQKITSQWNAQMKNQASGTQSA